MIGKFFCRIVLLALPLIATAIQAHAQSQTPGSVTRMLDMLGSTPGGVMARGPNAWGVTAAGTVGQCLISAGAAAPTWGSCAGASVTSVAAGNSSLTISPTTGDVLASINLANSNAWTAAQTIQSASATAFAVGRQGSTDPAFLIDASTASSTTGIKIKSAAAAGGVALSAISSGTNENLTLDAKGSGTVTINGTGTGGITLSRAVTLGSTINKLTLTAPASSATLTIADGKTATHNASTTFAGTDGKTLTISNSLTLAGTDATTMTFPNVSATIPRVVASGAKALATSAISSASCSSAQTDTATGTLTSDAIMVSFAADPTATTGYVPLTAGMLTIIYYPTADTVNFKVCNNTSSSITPGAVTINWRVIR